MCWVRAMLLHVRMKGSVWTLYWLHLVGIICAIVKVSGVDKNVIHPVSNKTVILMVTPKYSDNHGNY